MVPQDTVLFNDTIRYNLAYGRVDALQVTFLFHSRKYLRSLWNRFRENCGSTLVSNLEGFMSKLILAASWGSVFRQLFPSNAMKA